MRRGYILLYTIITIVAISILSVAILTNTAAYIRDNSLELQKNSAYISSQKILQLCLAYLKPYFSGIKGIMLGWTSSNVSQNVEWWDRFKKLMLSQTDGKYWENFFTRINEQKYYDPSVISQFKQDLVDFTLSGSVVVLPITGSYQVNQNPYSALVVSKANSGKLEAYSVAVVAVDFLNKYAYFTEIEKRPGGDTIYFISREIIDGPMRSNDIIHVSGNPRFKSSVEVKGVDIQSGRPIYDDPFSPKILTEQDIQAYRMSMIASNYSSDLNVLVKSVPDFLSSSGETGINLNLSRITRGQKSLTPTALIVEFKSAQGQGNDHFMKVYVEYDGPGSSGRDPLFTIKPRTSGNGYQIVIHGQNAEEWLGLSITGRERTVDVNFNGVLKSNLTVKLKNHSNNDKPMYVDGQYTVYSEKTLKYTITLSMKISEAYFLIIQ
ncbi:MAG TPA: hypothetical protein PLP64_01280 [Pseudothermotoga sp.]|nr:hypothetical protein [Pseudothermotoga sp.]